MFNTQISDFLRNPQITNFSQVNPVLMKIRLDHFDIDPPQLCHFFQDVFDPELPQWHLCPRTERHWPYLHLCPGLQIAHTVIQTLNGDARYMVVNPTSPVLTCFNPDYFRGLRSVRIKGGVLCNPFTRWD